MENKLFDQLVAYGNSDYYPCHMPGHKRNTKVLSNEEIFKMDITEIDGFDNLHHPEGIIKEEEERATRLYGAQQSFFLVNGSTVGNLSAVSACVKRGGKLLMARNCHKSVYNAVYLNELQVEYLYPEINDTYGIVGGISPQAVEQALKEKPGIEAVMITSPTYDGMISDIAGIASVVHRFGIPLIVDEAHGAHFGLDSSMPRNALQNGADVVIHSLHKTLPSLTQTAIMHVQGGLVSKERIARYQSIYQSTSPSYIFISSMTRCLDYVREHGKEAFATLNQNLDWFYQEVSTCKHLQVVNKSIEGQNGVFRFDPSKIIISTLHANCNGEELSQLLRERFHIEMEMSAPNYAQAIMTIMDEKIGFERLAQAIKTIDQELSNADTIEKQEYNLLYSVACKPEAVDTIYHAQNREYKKVDLKDAVGEVSAEYIYFYPPGIPLVTPGEVIDEKSMTVWEKCRNTFHNVKGIDEDRKVKIIPNFWKK